MAVLKTSLPISSYRFLMNLRTEAARSGASLYLVGGAVRDLLLERPIKDLDLAVEGNAMAIACEVGKQLGARITLHRIFGTATLTIKQTRIDMVTARRETYMNPGKLPEVAPSGIHDDLERRDFTINAMAIALSQPNAGKLLDPCGGMEDLSAGRIRVLHNESFQDDATRIFRAIRYEQRLSFEIAEETRECMLSSMKRDIFATISADRIRHEISLVLREEKVVNILIRAGALQVLEHLYPPLKAASHLRKIGKPRHRNALFYLGALAYSLEVDSAEAFIRLLQMPLTWATVIRDLMTLKNMTDQVTAPRISNSSLDRILNDSSPISAKVLACLTSNTSLSNRLNLWVHRLRFIKPSLNGTDLVSLGIEEGPVVGRLLEELRTARLEGHVTSREEEEVLAKTHLNPAVG